MQVRSATVAPFGVFLRKATGEIMSNIIPFSFDNQLVRAISVDDTPMLHARDAAIALGYANPAEAYQTHCKHLKQFSYRELLELGFAAPNPRGEYFIPESDIYRLVMRSKTENAERFQDWVMEEVLPSIRQTGSYTAPKAIPAERPTKIFPEYLRIAKLIGLDKNAAMLSANQATFKKTGENVLALMDITHLETDQRWFTPTDLGKRIDVSGRQFNLLLLERGLQEMDGAGHWCPTDSAKGLFRFFDTSKRHMDGTIVQQLKWSSDVLDMINRVAA